jgi:hypothetical protein
MPKRDSDRDLSLPEPGRTTAPLPNSPYRAGQYAPPPPPLPIYNTTPPPAEPPPSAYGGLSGVYPRVPSTAPKNRGGSFLGGIVAAIVVIALIGVGIAVLNGNKGSTAHAGTTTTAKGGPTSVPTVEPTTATGTNPSPTFTPTEPPATATPNPHMLPPPPAGFINFLPQGENWGLNYRIGTQVHSESGALPVTGQNVKAIVFDLGQSSTFTVYDLTQPISPDQAQSLFDAIAQALNASDIQILDQGPVTLGTNLWMSLHLRATIDGQQYEGYCFYTTHGTGANAVSMIAPAGDTFANVNTSDFTPMIDSFTYLS